MGRGAAADRVSSDLTKCFITHYKEEEVLVPGEGNHKNLGHGFLYKSTICATQYPQQAGMTFSQLPDPPSQT